MGETTHGGDCLLSKILISHSIAAILLDALADPVDLLVDLSSVVIAELTSTRNGERDTGRVPGTDTGDLSATSVRLSTKELNTPTLGSTSETLTLGDTDDVNHLITREDRVDRDLLLKERDGKVNLLSDSTTVDLNLNDMSSLAANLSLGDLSVAKGTDGGAVLLSALDLGGHVVVLSVVLAVLGEGLTLALEPVLVEATTALIRQVLSPDGGESTSTSRSIDVSNKTDYTHGGSLEDTDSLDDLLLVELGARLIDITDDVSHTSLEADEGGKVARLGHVILGE